MKLFNKTIDRQLFKQYSLGSDLSKQEVVAKIFNPFGNGTWFILNSDPQDPDYLWAIVDLGYGAEVGSVSRSELETYRGRFGMGFERDLSFDPVNALELYNGLSEGKYYADGGGVKKQHKDKNGKDVNIGDAIRIRILVGRYGQTKDYEGIVTKFDEYDNVELDGERSVKYTANYVHNDYEHGHHIWVEKINKKDINENLRIPKKFKPTFSGEINGKNISITGEDEFKKWLDKNYPNAVFGQWFPLYNSGWRYENGQYFSPNKLVYSSVDFYKSVEQGQGSLFSLMIPKNKSTKNNSESFADGGDIENFSDNQRMIMNQNVEVEHHHEELEDILEDKVPVPAWVVAKMETATQNLSDITHYLDGEKELMEDENQIRSSEFFPVEDEDEEENEEEDDDQEAIKNQTVVEPINVTAGTKAEMTKNFTDDAMGNLRGFLKGMEGIDLRDDYTFDYKDEQYEVEPIINSDENGVSNAVFSIFDGDGEEVGEVAYSREGGKQKFTANSEFFSWNNAKFEDGGYFDGTIPNVSTYMSTYADGGGVEWDKDSDSIRAEMGEFKIMITPQTQRGYYDISVKANNKTIGNEYDVYGIDNAKNKAYEIISNSNKFAKGGEIAKAEILGFSRNVMGTTDIEMKITGMRKPQDFIVYPIGKDDTDKIITIQSETRIGKIDLSSGRGLMSQSHSNGAYFVHFQMDRLTPFTLNESDLEDIKVHIFRTAGSNVGTRGIVSDNSGASGIYAKGGGVKDKNGFNIYNKLDDKKNKDFWVWEYQKPSDVIEDKTDAKMFEDYTEKQIVDYLNSRKASGNNYAFYIQGKKDVDFIFVSQTWEDTWDKYDNNNYANGGGLDMKYYVIDVKYGKVVSKGFDTEEEAKVEKFEIFEKTNNFFLSQKKMSKNEADELSEQQYAKGGMVVSSIKDIPNFTERLEQRRITYRGLGMGKVADDFYKLAGTSGTRIKVDGKEYYITDKEFDTFSRGADGKLRVKFDAPFRRGYADGGDITVLPFYLLKKEMSNEEQENVDIIHDAILIDNYEILPKGYSLKPLKSYRESGMNSLIVEVTPPKGNKFNLRVHTYELRDIEKEIEKTKKLSSHKGGSVKKDWWHTVVNPNEDFNNFDDKMPIDWDVDDFKSWVVSESDLDGNVDKAVLDVVKMPQSKLLVEYLNKNGSGKNNNEFYKEFGNWQSALYDIFTQMKKDYLFKKSLKYILKADIKTVTVRLKNGKEVTYSGADVLNGNYVLAKGGDIISKATYFGKNNVVGVELKDGTNIKPANGYWVKKGAEPIGAEPTPTSSASSEPKIGTTQIRKDMRGNWRAETNIDNFNGYDWRLSTVKTYSGNLVSSAQGGKTEATGTKGIVMFKYAMYQDPNHTLEVSKPKRLTDKVVTEQHDKALTKFKKFMETGMFKGGGKISNFDKLSDKVAKEYEGKPVKGKYQEEYGKYYSKEEAQEVGDKVAGKMKLMTADKKAFGGLFGGAKSLITKPKFPELDGKQVALKSGKYVQVFTQSGSNLTVLDLGKIGTGERPYKIDISEVDMNSFKAGGNVAGKKANRGTETLKKANELAKEIRKDGESWLDAKKRAFAQLKK